MCDSVVHPKYVTQKNVVTQNGKTSETISKGWSGSQVSTSSMSNKSMVLEFEGIRSFSGRVKTNRLEWICISPRFPAAMPIFISRVIVP